MNTKTLLGLGAIGGAIYLATSKKAQAKVKKTTGLSDVGKDPAKITKLREIVKEKQYKRISGSIVDMNTANIILQFYDNLTPENKKSYAKKSIQEMSRIAWSKAKTGLSDSGKKAQAKEKVKKYLLKWGNNENEVNKMINRSFEGAYNMHSPPLSPAKLAEIVIRIDGVIGVER